MDKFESMKSFTKVVENNGFAAAARKMGTSRSVINKHVLHLESDLGVQLLHRSTRKVTLTETGSAFYDRCIAILGDLQEAELAVSRLQEEPKGLLKINAPMSFGMFYLAPALADFMVQYPDLSVELTLNDRLVDPLEEGYDITIRITEPLATASLTVQPVAEAKRVICAAPSYLKTHGRPKQPEDLAAHKCLHYGNIASGNHWKFSKSGRDYTIRVTGGFCANNAEALRDAAVKGLGIVQLPVFTAPNELKNGSLVPLLEGFDLPNVFIFVIYPPNRHLSAKTRLFTDFMKQSFSDEAQWDQIK